MRTKLLSTLTLIFLTTFAAAPAFAAKAGSKSGGAVAAPAPAAGVEPFEEEDAFGGIMNTSIPMFKEIKQVPETPGAGQPVKVTVTIQMSGDTEENAQVALAELGYTAGGGKWASLPMKMAGFNWFAEIPGQPAGTVVTYVVRVKDSLGNVTTEAPGKSAWPANEKNMIPGATDADNSDEIVPKALDIVNTWVGYDDDYLYVGFRSEGGITSGTEDPPYVHIYGAKVTNPDVDQTEGLMVGKLLIHAPMGRKLAQRFSADLEKAGFIYPESGVGLVDIQKIMSDPVGGLISDADAEMTIEGNNFFGGFRRAAVGANPSGYLRFIFLTIANAGLDSFTPIPVNSSPYTQVYFRNHSYTVQ